MPRVSRCNGPLRRHGRKDQSEEYEKAAGRHIETLTRLEKTTPLTGRGLAESLTKFFADLREDKDLADGQIEWGLRLIAAARALAQ